MVHCAYIPRCSRDTIFTGGRTTAPVGNHSPRGASGLPHGAVAPRMPAQRPRRDGAAYSEGGDVRKCMRAQTAREHTDHRLTPRAHASVACGAGRGDGSPPGAAGGGRAARRHSRQEGRGGGGGGGPTGHADPIPSACSAALRPDYTRFARKKGFFGGVVGGRMGRIWSVNVETKDSEARFDRFET
jgi:hypothetical protein